MVLSVLLMAMIAFPLTRKEMKSMSIDNLFDKKPKNENIMFSITNKTDDTEKVTELKKEIEPEVQKQNTIGRPAKMFRFDEEGYEKMKNNGNFRLEF